MSHEELESRLKLWRLRNAGRVAELALQREPLTAAECADIDAIAMQPDAYAHYAPLSSAYYPLLPASGNDVSPLLPFFYRHGPSQCRASTSDRGDEVSPRTLQHHWSHIRKHQRPVARDVDRVHRRPLVYFSALILRREVD